MTAPDSSLTDAAPSNIVDLNSRRDPRMAYAAVCRQSADVYRSLAALLPIAKLDDRRDPVDVALRDVTTLIRKLETAVDLDARPRIPAALPQRSDADEAAWRVGEERDVAATKKRTAKARRALRDRLPAVADELQRLSAAVRDGHASLSEADSLRSLAAVFESLLNPRGVLSEGSCCDISESIDFARGTAFVQRNGDVAYDRGAEVAS